MASGKKKNVDEEDSSDDDNTSDMLRDIIDKEIKRDDSDLFEDEASAQKKSSDISKSPVLHTGEAGVDGDEIDYHVLKKIVDMAVKPVSFKDKIRLYYLYIIMFGVVFSLVLAAFWDAIMIRGHITWQLSFVITFPIIIGVYYWAVEVRERVDKRYPTWFDINNRSFFNYAEVGEKDGYLLIMPFKVYKQKVYKPDNPFKSGSPLLIAVDTKCIKRNEAGMITLGRLNYDMTTRATFSVEYDTDYVPNPDIYNLLFELNVTRSSQKHMRELKIESDLKYREMRKIKFDDEFEVLMKHIRMLLPVLSLMLRSKEHDVVSDIALMDKLGESDSRFKNLKGNQRDMLLDALRGA